MQDDKNFFYVVDTGSNSNQHMFSDVKKMSNAVQMSYVFNIKNPLLRTLNKIHYSIKINKIIEIPFKGIWDSFYIMNGDCGMPAAKKWIVLNNWSIRRFSLSYLRKMKNEENVGLVLLYLDPRSAVPDFYQRHINQVNFDLIYSFDEADCKTYGWKYATNLYSKDDIPQIANPEYDVYYIGQDKGRKELIERVYKLLTENGLKCNFQVVSETGQNFDNGKGFRYLDHRVSYEEILKGISEARVILEVVQEGQSGMTMRPYEAVFYNKKLLTNNIKVKEMDFYRTDYMSCFSSEEDIDIDFLKNRGSVDFEYHNQYSPINWLNNIPEDYQKKSDA